MARWLGVLHVAALAAGAGILGSGCGKAGAPKRDAGNLDAATASGGSTGTGTLLGSGGSTVSGGAGSPLGGAGGSAPGGMGGAGRDGGLGGAGGSAPGGMGGAGRDGGLGGASADAAGGDADASPDPKRFCEIWQNRTAEQDALEVEQYALFKASTVVEGTLGDFADAGGASYALLSVGRVWAGVSQYEGFESAVTIDRALYDQLGKGARVIAGFGQSDPFPDMGPPFPAWTTVYAVLPRSRAVAADLLDFHVWNTPNVAVVRIEELLDYGGIRLALVENLRGSLPASFLVPSSRVRPSNGMSVGTSWIGGFSELAKSTPTGSLPSTSLLELRPDTPDQRAAVAKALQALEPAGFATRTQAGLELAKADAVNLRVGWMYNQADLVAALEVTGIGNECCTDLGGICHASTVVEVLQGPAPAGQVLTGGHGYRKQKACGDRFLQAMGSSVSLADGLGLDCQGKVSVSATRPGSQAIYELPSNADNLALVRQWVASAPPLLRLYPAGKDLAAAAFALPSGVAS